MALEIKHIPILKGKVAKNFISEADANERNKNRESTPISFDAIDKMLERSRAFRQKK